MHAHLRPGFIRLAAAAFLLGSAAPLAAQGTDLRTEMTAGGETERYLRALQTAGAVPLYPWTIRGFSPAELDVLVPDSMGEHPWAARLHADGDSAAPRPLALVRPRMDAVYNSAFPLGANDGPVWAGRGTTVSGSVGLQLRLGPLSARVEPVAYWAQNADFELMPNGQGGTLRFQDARAMGVIDFPQRFGDGSFARVHPGESYVRLDVRGMSAGLSTATQVWGPAIDLPLVLGNNAPGFRHFFAGTTRPWKIGIGRLHGRVVWGDMRQSRYSPLGPVDPGSRRFMSGWLASFQPWGLDGLEVGAARFFHDAWPEDGLGLDEFTRPLESFFKGRLNGRDETGGELGSENQLASMFFRWVLPRAGMELYGEFMRDDHSWDLLDALLEPERSSAYTLGGRRVWLRGGRMSAVRVEWLSSQQGHYIQGHYNGPPYRHTILRQGHTVDGQLLASLAGYGGGGSVVALERYTPRGRWSVDWTRTRIAGPTYQGPPLPVNVMHSLGGEAVLFRGRVDAVVRLRGTMELNRHFEDDVFNLTAGLGLRVGL